jgi:hypothetical protein
MNKYLPSKKFAISLLVAVVIIGVSLVLTFGKGTLYESKKIGEVKVVDSAKFEAFKQVDTDSDGLPDWQETLYGTDPKKADTDADGTNDEDEMKANRDPLKANTASKGQEPNDKIDLQVIEKAKQAEAEFENLNDTQKLARSFLSQYLATQSAGRQMTQDEMNSVVDQMIKSVNIENIPDKYTDKDIVLSTNTDIRKGVEKYFNSINPILADKVVPATMSGLDLMNSLETNNWVIKIKDINDLTKTIISSADKMMAIPVPSIIQSEHLFLVNDIYKISVYLDSFKKINEDPIKSMAGLQGYTNLVSEIGLIIDNMELKLKDL